MDEVVKHKDNEKQVCLLEAMASCHSITYVNDKIIGDPLEIKMFEMTYWKLDEESRPAVDS